MAGPDEAITVTVKDSNGTLYRTGAFNQTNLVSSVTGMAGVTDSDLINPWGMSSSATSPIWVSDQGSGLATLYNPNGNPIKQSLVVTIPAIGTPSGPTGQVFNADTTATDFTIPGPGGTSVRSLFLFASLDGTIAGWAPGSTGGTASALTAATVTGAVFTGLAQASVNSTYYLYATDFTGTTGASGIDVFDPTFTNVSSTTFAGKFVDPNAIAGYLPYNIAFLNGDLYVAYAQPSGIVTTGGGYIDEFDTAGNFINRIYTDTAGTNLKGPWGMAIAPAGFGSFGGDLLVGSFGDSTSTAPNGTIIAINLPTTPGSPGTLAGTLSTPNGTITNPGIWGLRFGNGGSGGTTGTLYFSAGIDSQTEGLFGAIAFASAASVTVAALTPSAAQPLIAQGEGVVFSGPVASFTDSNPSATAGDYNYITIYWGDGTAATSGTISQPGGVGTAFLVSGTHTYADAGVNGGIGTYPITVDVHANNGTTVMITNTAYITDLPLTVTGKLNPVSDSGVSNSDDITSVVQPNFLGTTNQPDAKVTLYAQAPGGTPALIGQGVSNANDAWSITANQALADGSYVITAVAVDAAGVTIGATTTIVPNLVIDTVGPVITAATFDRFTDTVTVTYQDNLSGLASASIANGAFYHLSARPLSRQVPVPRLLLPTSITITPGATATAPVVVSVVFNNGHAVRGGRYLVIIDSGGGDTGIHDVAGNALDGNFYGTFPTGDGLAGGNFAASIDTFHNKVVLPPVPVPGRLRSAECRGGGPTRARQDG